jgi:hypothetical protein
MDTDNDNLVASAHDVPTERHKPNRTLSDDDVAAIAKKMKQQLIADFYEDVGKGVWGTVKKILIWGFISVAFYFAAKGEHIVQ